MVKAEIQETKGPSVEGESALEPASPRRGRLRRWRRWFRNALLLVPPVLVLAVLAGQIQQVRLARAYPAPGEMIHVGDQMLHVIRSGDGPTVVFENGPGGMGLDWSLVVPHVSEFGTTVAYDRAGLGWSEPSERPRDIVHLVEDLKAMLDSIEAPAPYVLVGHSYGALIVRAFAYTYPGEVAGLVLVDAAHEDQLDFYPREYAAKAESMGQMMARLRWVYRAVSGSGIPALFPSMMSNPVADKLGSELAAARRAATVIDSSHSVASTDEMAALLVSLDQVRGIRRPLGDMPVRIISHGRPVGAEAGVPNGLEEAVEEAWQNMQRDLLDISTDTRLEVAEDSGHDIHLEQPDLVVATIRELVSEGDRSLHRRAGG